MVSQNADVTQTYQQEIYRDLVALSKQQLADYSKQWLQ